LLAGVGKLGAINDGKLRQKLLGFPADFAAILADIQGITQITMLFHFKSS
jgi:hypothetical protein